MKLCIYSLKICFRKKKFPYQYLLCWLNRLYRIDNRLIPFKFPVSLFSTILYLWEYCFMRLFRSINHKYFLTLMYCLSIPTSFMYKILKSDRMNVGGNTDNRCDIQTSLAYIACVHIAFPIISEANLRYFFVTFDILNAIYSLLWRILCSVRGNFFLSLTIP